MLDVRLRFALELERLLFKAHVAAVPVTGERVAVIDEAFARVQADVAATDEIGRSEELFFLEGHAGVVGVNGDFGKLASAEQEREWVFSIVLNDFFFDFDSIVSKEVVEDIVIHLAFQSLVVPSDIEGQHQAIILNVFLKTIIGMASSQFHFKILFIFPDIKF